MKKENQIIDSGAAMTWGSDYLAEAIRKLDLRYLAINPGASLRGLHDSLVNYLGNEAPQLLLCLHEEHAVAVAQGYAKVTGRPMGVAVHSNVGLMHASMAIYNAWCDRAPMMIFGATGPVDAARRRPWIDWLHTAKDQGALVRPFIKWDDQPASLPAAAESLCRAGIIATTAPQGPVYVCFDVSLQEDEIPPGVSLPDPSRYARPARSYPDPRVVDALARRLASAGRIVILAGRIDKAPQAWRQRVELAERLGATVLSDLKQAAAFPTAHPLHVPISVGDRGLRHLREADIVLGLDWTDPAGTLAAVAPDGESAGPAFIHCSPEQYVHNGWSMDHQALPAADTHFLCEPEALVDALLALDDREQVFAARPRSLPAPVPPVPLERFEPDATVTLRVLATALKRATQGLAVTLIKTPIGWSNDVWHYAHPLDYLGRDGGAGIGSGPGIAVGAALALEGSGRLPVAVIGDGDFMYSASAFWTAARYRIPLLVIVANNSSYFNDEIHQESVARRRGRPLENKRVAQALDDPDIDIAMIARGEGAYAIGPVKTAAQLDAALADTVARVRDGGLCVIDVRVLPGYE